MITTLAVWIHNFSQKGAWGKGGVAGEVTKVGRGGVGLR